MHVKEVAHTVTCAVEIALALLPERHAGHGIELMAACAFGIYGGGYGYVALHHESEVMTHLGRGSA